LYFQPKEDMKLAFLVGQNKRKWRSHAFM